MAIPGTARRGRRRRAALLRAALVLPWLCLVTGCVGLAHSSHVCCGDVPGKYYRATRVDLRLMRDAPLATPLILVADLPFAVVYETLEAPFVLAGLVDPRPPTLDGGAVAPVSPPPL